MDLTAEQFAALVTSLTLEPRSGAAEKRRASRIEGCGQVLITVCDGGGASHAGQAQSTRTRAKLSNISSRGIGLTYGERLESGRQLIVHMPTKTKPDVQILCTVVHCVERSARLFAVGAEFTCVLSPAEVPRALDEPAMHARIQQSMLG
ncbi:MAG: PilZ domain-containing protein [Planctomycetota bacterium]|nr:PilZ domain-containing protein [Planctomycetota bacterium]